jgi:hypothetical protein
MPFPSFQFPLYRLSDEVGALFALIQDGIHAVKGALGKAGRELLEIDLFSAHFRKIYLISPIDKPIIDDILYPLKREIPMTKQDADRMIGKSVRITDVYGKISVVTLRGRNQRAVIGDLNGVDGQQALVDLRDIKTWELV